MTAQVCCSRWFAYSLAFLLTVTAARSAGADTLTVAWDPNPDPSVVGYVVYVGTQPGVYAANFNVGNTTAFAYTNAAPGQPYYFAVASYSSTGLVGVKSTEVSGVSNAAPVLANPGNQSSTVGTPVSLQLSGSDPAGQVVSYGVTALPPGLTLTPSTGNISGTPTTAGSYLVTAVVSDGILSDAETFTWTVAPAAVSSSSAPTVTITVPTTGSNYSTEQTFVTLGGTATDDTGVTDVTWTSDRGNSGRATGTDNWIAGVPLQRGPNTITVRARDTSGNVSTRAIVVKSTGKK